MPYGSFPSQTMLNTSQTVEQNFPWNKWIKKVAEQNFTKSLSQSHFNSNTRESREDNTLNTLVSKELAASRSIRRVNIVEYYMSFFFNMTQSGKHALKKQPKLIMYKYNSYKVFNLRKQINLVISIRKALKFPGSYGLWNQCETLGLCWSNSWATWLQFSQ